MLTQMEGSKKTMKTVEKIIMIKREIAALKSQGKQIGFVPTMGYLHDGHLSLVRESLKKTDITVVSIFVNPTQFSPQEDFNHYPRDRNHDFAILEKEGVDYLFVPSVEEMYPEGYRTYVEVQGLQDRLCGRSRPGHFRGVCTVVLKFFHIVQPDMAFFGQKDAQQAAILKRMTNDLDLDVQVEVLPIVRDRDGLALSSRNVNLNPEERKAALVLSRSLNEARRLIDRGERDSALLIQKIQSLILSEPYTRIDYVEIVNMDMLQAVSKVKGKCMIALAVYVGKTRLIDNTIVCVKE